MGASVHHSLVFFIILFAFTGHAHAFGAGNIASISRIEGQNWRHGDIEDALLTITMARVAGGRKFSKLDVQRVYFGNWLRDYSQAVDVGTLKYVSAEAIRVLIWVLGFLSFGYGTKEFEVTTERLGCYEPTEHIDNPLGYAEGDDARNYDRRLRGPVDEERELSINLRTGLKNYIASEDLDIATSADLVRRVFYRSIQLGRRYGQSGNEEDLHEALRLLGTGLHCLEDYAAHSNYTELSIIELGESGIFPHVGRNTQIELPGVDGYVYPIVTGTFGGVDFFHSVLGELSDKATQSEVQSLEGVISDSQSGAPSDSFIQDLLSKIPDGLIGDSDSQVNQMDEFKAQSENAKEQNENASPREPEEWTRYLDDVHQKIYPVLEWHDDLIKNINRGIENIPVLPGLIEQIQEQVNVFVFSVLAPYVLPIIRQVKVELQTGSSEVIQSSREQQHIVFNDDDCSNPTHSMLSKDHFSNVLNEPAGRIASQIIKWTVPQLMECWDDEDIDIRRTIDRIVTGVFHHPALREHGADGAADIRHIMFSTVSEWWDEKGETGQEMLREQLSRDGVLEGKNHKEGVHDSGHGCGKPLSLHKGDRVSTNTPEATGIGKIAAEAAGGGALGGLVGGLVSGVGSMLLNDPRSRSSDRQEHSDTDDQWESQQTHGQHRHDSDYERHESPGQNYRHQHHDHPEHEEHDHYGPPRRYENLSQNEYGQQYSHSSGGYVEYASQETHSYREDGYANQYSEPRYEYQSSSVRGEYITTAHDEPRYDSDNQPSQAGYHDRRSESQYTYENRPSYREQEDASYYNRGNEEYAPRYQEEGHNYDGGYNRDSQHLSRDEYRANRRDSSSSSEDEHAERRYGHDQRYNQSQEYGY